ncbi:MAG: hypothetical protein ACJ76H_09250 [Bacteriovoracaceae bacterium]
MLKSSRFAAILCEKLPTKTILYNPFLMHEVKKARNVLSETKGLVSLTDLISKYRESKDNQSFLSGSEEDWKAWLENLTMTPVFLPRFHDEHEYDQFISSHQVILTEIFSPTWGYLLGSSRGLLIGNVQMKGCGISLPPPGFKFTHGSGIFSLGLSIKSFIFSGLMDSTVPLGSNQAIAAQRAPWGDSASPLGIYLRVMKVPRIIQVGPELGPEGLSYVRSMIESELKVNTARKYLELYTAQLGSMVALSGAANCTPDNLLINGQFIDEESWFWPKDLGSKKFSFEFECEPGKLDWKTASFRTSTFLRMKGALETLHKFAELIYGAHETPDFDEVSEMFSSHVNGFIPDWEAAWPKGLTLSENFRTEDFLSWQKALELDGWTSESEFYKDQGAAIHFSKPRISSEDLAGKFNSRARPDFTNYAVKLSKLPEQIEATDLSNNIQKLIGSSGFILPLRFLPRKGLVKNVLSVGEFLELSYKRWPALKGNRIDMIVWDGTSERTLSDITPLTKLDRNCVPLSFEVHSNGKSYALACLKTILTAG